MKLTYCQLNRVKNGLNAVSIFARLGDEKQVEQLVHAGGHLTDAVYGYALGGHIDHVEPILKNYPDLIRFAAKGYARGGHSAEIQKLEPIHDTLIKGALFEGYAQANREDKIETPFYCNSDMDYKINVIKGLAQCNHVDTVMKYAISENSQVCAIGAAALSGNATLVNQLLACQEIVWGPKKIALSQALLEYCRGRHYEYVEELLRVLCNPACVQTLIGKNGIDESDVRSLSRHITDKALHTSLLEHIKLYNGILNIKVEAEENKEEDTNQDVITDEALEALFETARLEINAANSERSYSFNPYRF